ncbi:hypothetical protein K7X08_011739 [Anisodus acutangulus]|uniref:G-patch domain-containing protein n=1 Tax=Anisodus acutangulus TaxID=402998 RepID=A0A9Q1MNM7_9SOLA|nr:hypothetical protein K7X08_011739 [Anisodus acutangulus]
MRWRAEAAKVQPPMAESEMTTLFVQSMKDATYYERMISVIGRNFSEVVRMGDFIEEGIKTGRITNLAALQATSKAIQSDSFGGAIKKRRDGASPVMAVQNIDKIEALIKEGIIQLKGPPPNVNNNPLPNHDNANINMITVDEENSLEGTIVPVRTEERVESSALITPIITVQVRAPFEVEVLPPKSRMVTPSVDTKTAPWSYSIGERSKGKEKQIVEVVVAGMTRSGRCYAPADNPKKVVTETEVEEFWRKMPTKEYSVVEQLKKTPAQISLLSLLMNSPDHGRALLEVLKEAYVPRETTGEKLSALVGQILEAHKVSFHDKELPPEGLGHNKALNITVKCMNKFISKIRESHVRVKGFDGAQRSVMGEMDLTLQVGPVEFVVEFQVLDISTGYNLLMGRPWIHVAGAVPSTLHQSLKFVWDHHEVVVHGEGSNSIRPEGQIPAVESVETLDGSVFHVREITCASKAEILKLPRVLTMVAHEMLKNGFKPGRGLGLNLEGMVEPIHLLSKKDTFGLGYKPTSKEVLSVNLRKEKDTPLPKPVPPLNQSFVKAYAAQESNEDDTDDLAEGLKSLFIAEEDMECNVILDDFDEGLTIWDAEHGDILKNWTCAPALFLREAW